MAALGVLFALINVRSYRLLLLWSLDGALRRRALILVLIKLPVLLLLIFLFTRLSPAALFSVLAGFFCFVPAAILFLLGTRRKEER